MKMNESWRAALRILRRRMSQRDTKSCDSPLTSRAILSHFGLAQFQLYLGSTATEQSARLCSASPTRPAGFRNQIEALNETVQAPRTPVWDSLSRVSSDFVHARLRDVNTL